MRSSDAAVELVAIQDVLEGHQVFASYTAGTKIDGIKMLQAFGWLPTDRVIASCAFDCVRTLHSVNTVTYPLCRWRPSGLMTNSQRLRSP